ncbi:MAG: hypothetical protein K0R49_83 [Burkholderiales bacterium]|jgi:hypothetical protein|nr:hypothetical protein [Burkholderiales bacterium]
MNINSLTNKKVKHITISSTQFNPDYCGLLIEHCESGHSLETFAGVYNISPDKIVLWAMEYPNFKDAAKIALTKQMYYWECQLLEGMRTGEKSQIECAKLMITSFKNVTENKIRESLYDDYKEHKNEKVRTTDTDLVKELQAKLNKLESVNK